MGRSETARSAAEALSATTALAGVIVVALGLVLAAIHGQPAWLLLSALGGVLVAVGLRALRRAGLGGEEVDLDGALVALGRIEHVRVVEDGADRVSLEATVTVPTAHGELLRTVPIDADRSWAMRHVVVGARLRIWHRTLEPDDLDDVLWMAPPDEP